MIRRKLVGTVAAITLAAAAVAIPVKSVSANTEPMGGSSSGLGGAGSEIPTVPSEPFGGGSSSGLGGAGTDYPEGPLPPAPFFKLAPGAYCTDYTSPNSPYVFLICIISGYPGAFLIGPGTFVPIGPSMTPTSIPPLPTP